MPLPAVWEVVCLVLGKNDVGRAIRTTPRKETRPAIWEERVKGSCMRTEQAQQATIGARKVITVASESGRYWSESGIMQSMAEPNSRDAGSQAIGHSQYIPYTPKNPPTPREMSNRRTSRGPNGACSTLASH